MSRITVDLRSRTPIFEQIISSVRELVILGIMLPDEPLPSVRSLAAELAINPNTIQKAYAELERQGVIYSLAGRGNFVSSDTSELCSEHRKMLVRNAVESALEAAGHGVDKDEILAAVKNALEGGKSK
ncbi:MAG: GntR family transcriptional regulator [Clostridia bacterium]|nr:GntR family transcriptional regulator [Clostridia bacterium]MBQ6614454.1 GntR family transcriptional regulator [Clostridia bacterium]